MSSEPNNAGSRERRSRALVRLAGAAWILVLVLALWPQGPATIGRVFLGGAADEAPGAELPALIRGLDRDEDGRVSHEEFHVFEALDRDKDYFVDTREARAGTDSRTGDSRGVDQGGDLIRPLPAHDLDGDMRVSPSEFPGPRSLFDRLDKDLDGFLDLAGGAPGSAWRDPLSGRERAVRGQRVGLLEFVPADEESTEQEPESN